MEICSKERPHMGPRQEDVKRGAKEVISSYKQQCILSTERTNERKIACFCFRLFLFIKHSSSVLSTSLGRYYFSIYLVTSFPQCSIYFLLSESPFPCIQPLRVKVYIRLNLDIIGLIMRVVDGYNRKQRENRTSGKVTAT